MKFYQGKTVWIIGGTFGIGFELANQLAKVDGCSVIVSGRSLDKLNTMTNCTKIPFDATNNVEFATAVDELLKSHQKVDIIIFCVGSYEPMNIDSFNATQANAILQTNLGSMVGFVENIPRFYGKCSNIAIVSSVAGYFGMPNSLFYGASKAGLSNLAECLYIELKKHKIDIKLINPGFVQTRLTQKNSFKMPFIISPQAAASIILKRLCSSKFEIAFPWVFVAILKIFKKLPFKLRAFVLQL